VRQDLLGGAGSVGLGQRLCGPCGFADRLEDGKARADDVFDGPESLPLGLPEARVRRRQSHATLLYPVELFGQARHGYIVTSSRDPGSGV
jgi:hypothetical protein